MFSGYVEGSLPAEYQMPLDGDFTKVGDGLVGFSKGKTSDGNFVQFYTKPLYRDFKSKQTGRIIYEDVLFVSIQAPGDKTAIEVHMATEEDFRKYPYQYEMYKRGLSQLKGTPIEKAEFLTPVQIATYTHMGIKSIEQLAEMNDTQIQSLGIDGREARKIAKIFVDQKSESVKADALASKFAQQKSELMAEIEKLKAQINGDKKEDAKEDGKEKPVKKEKLTKKEVKMNGDFEEIDMTMEEAFSQGYALKEKDD